MTKTCYFCEHEIKCGVPYPYFKLITEDVCKARHLTNRFKPTEDWLYIEKLEKENEELKKEVEDLRVGLQVSGAIINELEIPKKKVKE